MPCTSPSECPPPANECVTATCVAGQCGTAFVAANTPISIQTPGDCHENVCDGMGKVIVVVDDMDVPPSNEQCAPGVCKNGVPATADAPQGTTCAQDGGVVCDGQGNCTQTFSVLRVGTGMGTLSSSTAPAFVDTYYPLAGAMPTTVALPTATGGSGHQLTISGTATSEGALSRSADGHYLALAGYATAPGLTSSGVPRVVGRIDAMGAVDTTTELPSSAFSSGNVRGAATADGTHFWVSGDGSGVGVGVWYVALGASGMATQILQTPNNTRVIDIFGGQLYVDSGSAGFTAVLAIGSGEPTTANQIATPLPGMVSSGASPYGFVFVGTDTLYLADSTHGLSRWTLKGSTWVQDLAFAVLPTGCIGVTGWATSTGDTLIVTTTSGAIDRVEVPAIGSPVLTTLVGATANVARRGVALAPH